MASKMKGKCEKYLENRDKMNLMIFFVVAFDSQYKIEYLEFVVTKIYPKAMVDKLIEK